MRIVLRWSKIKTGHCISPLPFSLSDDDSLACSFRNCRHSSCYTIWRRNIISDQPAFDRCDCFSFTLSWFGFLGLLAICGKRAAQPQQDSCLWILDMSAPLVLKEYCNPKMSLLLARTLTILVHANIDNTLVPLSSSCMLVLHALAQTSTWTLPSSRWTYHAQATTSRCPERGVEFGAGLNLILQIVTNDLKALVDRSVNGFEGPVNATLAKKRGVHAATASSCQGGKQVCICQQFHSRGNVLRLIQIFA